MPCLGPEGEGGRDFKLEESEEAIKPLPHNDATKNNGRMAALETMCCLPLGYPRGVCLLLGFKLCLTFFLKLLE